MGLTKKAKNISLKNTILKKCHNEEIFSHEEYSFIAEFLKNHDKCNPEVVEDNLKNGSDSEDIFGEADKKLGANYDLIAIDKTKTPNKIESEFDKLFSTPNNSGFSKPADRKRKISSSAKIQDEQKENKSKKVFEEDEDKKDGLSDVESSSEKSADQAKIPKKNLTNDSLLDESDKEEQKEEKNKRGRGKRSLKKPDVSEDDVDEETASNKKRRASTAKKAVESKSVENKKKKVTKDKTPKKSKNAKKDTEDTSTMDSDKSDMETSAVDDEKNVTETSTLNSEKKSTGKKALSNQKKSKNEDEANFSDSSDDNEPMNEICDELLKNMNDKEDKPESVEKYRGTFDDRRNFITEQEPTVMEIKKKYPYLFEKNMVFLEFELITDKPNLFEIFKENVNLYAEGITSVAKSKSLTDKIETILEDADDDKKKWIGQASSLMMLPKYMGDNRKGVIVLDYEELPEDHDNRPYIQCEGEIEFCLQKNSSFKIFVEDIELCTVTNIIEAYYALMASYYIFNAVYPECCENTFYCLERLYIDFSDGSTKLKSKIEKLITSLAKSGKKNKK